jgi:hypothetical protein
MDAGAGQLAPFESLVSGVLFPPRAIEPPPDPPLRGLTPAARADESPFVVAIYDSSPQTWAACPKVVK